ncbi:MAG: hypothetical protein WBE86_07290 [Candidatus Acidiferrales bacterium]
MDKHEKIAGAIEVLQDQLNGLVQQVADQKRMINSLRASIGETPLYNDVVVENVAAGGGRPDEFYGQPLSTCVRVYLERRKQACTALDILAGLQNGGFDFDAAGWKEKDRLRILAVTLAKNTKAFHRLPNGTFGLVSWYDAKTIAAARRNSEAAANETQGSNVPATNGKAAKAGEGST